jgi:hypothetical protein
MRPFSVVEVIMRWISSPHVTACVLCLLLFALPARPQIPAPLGRCGPRATDPADWPRNPSLDQPASPNSPARPAVHDTAQVQRDARELAQLSATLPADLDQVNRGLLPKDIVEKLKHIEKLSKRLRNELAQ